MTSRNPEVPWVLSDLRLRDDPVRLLVGVPQGLVHPRSTAWSSALSLNSPGLESITREYSDYPG
jgi:hypothetical protein